MLWCAWLVPLPPRPAKTHSDPSDSRRFRFRPKCSLCSRAQHPIRPCEQDHRFLLVRVGLIVLPLQRVPGDLVALTRKWAFSRVQIFVSDFLEAIERRTSRGRDQAHLSGLRVATYLVTSSMLSRSKHSPVTHSSSRLSPERDGASSDRPNLGQHGRVRGGGAHS